MDESVIVLLDKISDVVNTARALGIDLSQFADDAGRIILTHLDKTFTAKIAEIKNAFRRPSSGSIN